MAHDAQSPYASSHTLRGSTHNHSGESTPTEPSGPKTDVILPTTATILPPRSPTARRNTIRGRIVTPRTNPSILPPAEAGPTELALKQKQNYSHHFLDPVIRPLTWAYAKAVFLSVAFLVTLMWAALPLYWGSLAPGLRHGPGFRTWVVDFDGGELGAFVTESVMNSTLIGTKQHLGWEVAFPRSLEELTHDIVEEHAWAAIVINQGATSSLQAARANGDAQYDPSSAITLYIEGARNNNAVSTLIVPFSTSLLEDTLRRFNSKNIAEFVSSISSNSTAISVALRAPAALSGAWWETVDLRPWNAGVATAMTVVGQIYISVFCFILAIASFPVWRALEPYLTNRAAMLLRVSLPAIAYIPLSLSFAMISLPFKAPFGTKYTYGGGFFLYFAYVYMDMLALGLAIEAAMSVLQPRFMAYFLVSWLIVNVSTPVEPHEMQVWWYRYGYGMPFFNHAEAVNTILFNTKNVLGRNAGVLIAWTALSTITTAGLTWYMRREKVAKHRAGLANGGSSKPQ